MDNRSERKREAWRRERAAYRAMHPERCGRCARLRDLAGRLCAFCSAYLKERGYPEHDHDTVAHAAMLLRSRLLTARCAASGLSLAELSVVGEALVVDRINPWRGYVRDNMQLLAETLNRSKARGLEVPEWAVDELRWALQGDAGGF